VNADALCVTPAARAALGTLRATAGADSPMERHCLRQFAIAERLAGDREFDRELLLCACWLHDLGLYTHSRDPYVTEGARVAARVLEPFGWPPERLQRCTDACEQHHAPRSRMGMGLEVELIRRSDLVDVTAGLVNFGLDRRWLRNLFGEVPRDGLWRLIGSAVLGELRHRPATLTQVLLSPRRTRLGITAVLLASGSGRAQVVSDSFENGRAAEAQVETAALSPSSSYASLAPGRALPARTRRSARAGRDYGITR
jgi:hypothetical protein